MRHVRGSTRVSTVSLASGAGNKGVGGGEPSKSATSKQRKRVREVGETATFVRKQDSSIFGIVEGLGLQYKMGICGDAVHTDFYITIPAFHTHDGLLITAAAAAAAASHLKPVC